MINKISKIKEKITNIKNGINREENKTSLIVDYIDDEIPIENIKLFAETINNDIELYEKAVAYTWFQLGYNYIQLTELTHRDMEEFTKIAQDLNYTPTDAKNNNIIFYKIFSIWYNYNNSIKTDPINEN